MSPQIIEKGKTYTFTKIKYAIVSHTGVMKITDITLNRNHELVVSYKLILSKSNMTILNSPTKVLKRTLLERYKFEEL